MMRRVWVGVLAASAMVLVSCAGRPDGAAVRAALMAADRAFAEATAQRGGEGWASYFEGDARQFETRGVLIGGDAIRAAMTRAFADTTARLLWHPVSAVAAASGELGYTIGRWESRARGKDGAWTADGSGNYVTIWRRQGDGSWKVAVDIGNADPVARPPARP
jgi:ketosteroid isomerase-like protein